ncbi:uncharacterized N-acetyltransferase p20-like [Macadamia integrifolia]|uniref:uncharacterized N-acetyltransferase p20-like n=1 Tax=Macadamia integrifolia TaxID=60698 RepID=UPI001C4E75CC|nr:uncharacterized N-acetyltransferase p20-like [Macadamia integrifolia]
MKMNSSKISLRPFELSDVDDFMLMVGDDRAMRFTRWNTFTSKEDALMQLKNVCMVHPWCRSICLDDRSVGLISVRPASGDDRCRAEIGYGLAVDYWGQGITTIAVKMALPIVFKEMPYLLRIQALVDPENKASQRVLEKVGFIKEGLLRNYTFHKGVIRDVIFYGFLSTDSILD